MIGYILTIEEKDSIQGQEYAPYQSFSCVQDINDVWFTFLTDDDKRAIIGSNFLPGNHLVECLFHGLSCLSAMTQVGSKRFLGIGRAGIYTAPSTVDTFSNGTVIHWITRLLHVIHNVDSYGHFQSYHESHISALCICKR